tara:strand:+ start:290 stop:895 length:606 start_codon:yes stop_codon:yes gene_type:complete
MLFGQEPTGVRSFGDRYAAFRAFTLTAPAYVTDGMTLTREWLVGTTSYFDLSDITAASARVDVTASPTDTGVIMEAGGTFIGLVMYVYNGVMYFQCGEGSAFGSSSGRAELSYTLPVGEDDYVFEWSADVSNAVLYVNGLKVSEQTFTFQTVAGGDAGAVGRIALDTPINRGGFVSTHSASIYTNTITKCLTFRGQVTTDV